VPRGKVLAALLALVPHLAHAVNGCHVQLQLKVASELLFALGARVQGSRVHGTRGLPLLGLDVILARPGSPHLGLFCGIRCRLFG